MSKDEGHSTASDFLDPEGHAPVIGKQRKTATRRKKEPKPRKGGVPMLEGMFAQPEGEQPQTGATGAAAGSSTEGNVETPSYPLHFDNLPFRTSGQSDIPNTDGANDASDPQQGVAVNRREYSNEARVYHSKYAELSEAHDQQRYDYCREGCLDLLTEPNLPVYTRVQILQMVSTLFRPNAAEGFLQEAGEILGRMNQDKFQVRLLQQDNENMLEDLKIWRAKKDLSGKDLAEEDQDDDDEPSEAWFKLDRELAAKEHKDVQEELEPFGEVLPTPSEVEKAELVSNEPASMPPSPPPEEDTGMLSPSDSE